MILVIEGRECGHENHCHSTSYFINSQDLYICTRCCAQYRAYNAFYHEQKEIFLSDKIAEFVRKVI